MAGPHYFHGTGRRKTSVARVRLFAGDGAVVVNGKPVEQYFGRDLYRQLVEHAFRVSETLGKFSTTVRVEGGGVTGQAEAIQHGYHAVAVHPTNRLHLRARNRLLESDDRQRFQGGRG